MYVFKIDPEKPRHGVHRRSVAIRLSSRHRPITGCPVHIDEDPHARIAASHYKIGVTLASTSSMIAAGTLSSLLAPRATRSITRG